jgi:2-polyprenyl-3-methyl-5-hydroxy-6-metoxy-1,4-benzoquinol methylase
LKIRISITKQENLTIMKKYKDRLYEAYVSSGQVGRNKSLNPEKLFAPSKAHIQRLISKYLINDNKQQTIIDIGCGHGTYVYFLQKNNFTNVSGFDISKEQIDFGKQLGITNIEHKSIDQFFSEDINKADVYLLIDILEHLTYEEIFSLLDKIYGKLNKGGKIIIHIPNAEGIFGMRIRYGDLTHEAAFTPQSINQLLSVVGFSKITCYEDKPSVHGIKSFVRRVLWELLTMYFRLLLIAETGNTRFVLSQNMTVVASL